jgi:hypothetical protein
MRISDADLHSVLDVVNPTHSRETRANLAIFVWSSIGLRSAAPTQNTATSRHEARFISAAREIHHVRGRHVDSLKGRVATGVQSSAPHFARQDKAWYGSQRDMPNAGHSGDDLRSRG